MKFGFTSPMRKAKESDDHPELLMNVAQTKESGCLGGFFARQVTSITRNPTREMITNLLAKSNY